MQSKRIGSWRTVTSLLTLVVVTSLTTAGQFEENWDSIGQGGDGINTFEFMALFEDNSLDQIDGSRCQYNDPDNPDAKFIRRDACRPWNGHDWHVDLVSNSPNPKAFSGDGSLHLGKHISVSGVPCDSYTLAQLSAAVSPIVTLGQAERNDGPQLRFSHIVAVADDRTFTVPDGMTIDRAVVQLASHDPVSGERLSPWTTIEATKNGYHAVPTVKFSACTFDPVDDGHTEDDVNTPPGELPFGPSSTCAPRTAFSNVGDWTSRNRRDTGRAQSKLGRLGRHGDGVWIESRFDLRMYAGETVRFRLLFSGIEISGPIGITWPEFFGCNLGNAFRGWIIDDFRVTGVREVIWPVPTPDEL